MFHFHNDINWNQFFRFDKKWIENMNWADQRISPAAKAILPVIGCHCNECGEAFPGEETIAALSGLTAKSVRKGIHDLEGFPGFNWSYYLTRLGKRGKRFNVSFPPKGEKGRVFFFHRGIMDGGIWRELKPSAKALYPVMRYFSRYDVDSDESLEDLSDFDDRFANRRWELCGAEVGQLARFAGIDRRSIADAIQSLQKNFLIKAFIDENGDKAWKVYLIPEKYWKASYLNQQLKDQAVS